MCIVLSCYICDNFLCSNGKLMQRPSMHIRHVNQSCGWPLGGWREIDAAPPDSFLILSSSLDLKAQIQIQAQEKSARVPPLQALQRLADLYARYKVGGLGLWGSVVGGWKRHNTQSWRPCQACGWRCSEAAIVARHEEGNLPLSLLEFSHYSLGLSHPNEKHWFDSSLCSWTCCIFPC